MFSLYPSWNTPKLPRHLLSASMLLFFFFRICQNLQLQVVSQTFTLSRHAVILSLLRYSRFFSTGDTGQNRYVPVFFWPFLRPRLLSPVPVWSWIPDPVLHLCRWSHLSLLGIPDPLLFWSSEPHPAQQSYDVWRYSIYPSLRRTCFPEILFFKRIHDLFSVLNFYLDFNLNAHPSISPYFSCCSYSISEKQKNVKQADFADILFYIPRIPEAPFFRHAKTLPFSQIKQYNASRKKIVLPAGIIQPEEKVIADTIYSVLQNLAYYRKIRNEEIQWKEHL